MDPVAHFIATTLAAALLSETAKDTYVARKAKLADGFEIKDELAILEKNQAVSHTCKDWLRRSPKRALRRIKI